MFILWGGLFVFVMFVVWWIGCLRDSGESKEIKSTTAEFLEVADSVESKTKLSPTKTYTNDESKRKLLRGEAIGFPTTLTGHAISDSLKFTK
ncbi:hypothetical protein TUM3794_20240 [Shewanella colwelliana]|uniref:Uncharacterized protein n=1 Tax=Shewanella colwelliana TaxID=23 RepID=A0ABQ4P0I4_SHECO|nr:hypothetical protein TUM3794_20240 [Shewanella colwelliana]